MALRLALLRPFRDALAPSEVATIRSGKEVRRLAQSVDASRSANASRLWLFVAEGAHRCGGPAKGDTIRKSCQRFSVPGMQLRMVSPEQAGEPRAPEKIPPESRCRPSWPVARS